MATAGYHPSAEGLTGDVAALNKLSRYVSPQSRAGRIQGYLSSNKLSTLIDGTVRRIAQDERCPGLSHRAIAGLLKAENRKPTPLMPVIGAELVKRRDDEATQFVSLTAAAETVRVHTYAGHFIFSRQAAVNSA